MKDFLLLSKKVSTECRWSESLRAFSQNIRLHQNMFSSCVLSKHAQHNPHVFSLLSSLWMIKKPPGWNTWSCGERWPFWTKKKYWEDLWEHHNPTQPHTKARSEKKMCMPLGRWSIWYLSSPYIYPSTHRNPENKNWTYRHYANLCNTPSSHPHIMQSPFNLFGLRSPR